MTFVIAECGVNWRNLDEADKMIWESAKAGADACKFQAYEPDFDIADTPYADILNAIALDESAIRYLYWRCRAAGVEFMATPMYPAAVDLLNPYVKRWKIRYKDRDNTEILNKCEATGKPMLISTDIPIAKTPNSKMLYCDPEYPPDNKDRMICFDETITFDKAGFDGFSCHYPSVQIAEKIGHFCDFLEVHVKRDEYNPPWCCPDNNVSITMSELAELCRRLKR